MQGMRDLLRGSLGRSLRTLTPLDRLSAAWPVVCGPALASRGEPIAFAEGRLTIRVLDAAWRDQMWSSRAWLASDLARVASVEVREIHFEGGFERPRRPAPGLDGARTRRVGRSGRVGEEAPAARGGRGSTKPPRGTA